MESSHRTLFKSIDSQKDEIVRALMEIVRIPAISPTSGGDGELKKAERLMELIEGFGFDTIERYDAPDERVPSGIRPNIIAVKHGSGSERRERICVVAHMDVVPPGDLSKWTNPPYEPVIRENILYGRGVEDNGQELIASIYGLKALTDAGLTPDRTIAIVLVADEETGSAKGIKYLIDQGVFSPDDLIIVPDSGNDSGTLMEVSEKSIMWLKIKTIGRQCHASTPDHGKNAFRAACYLATAVDEALHTSFNLRDELFDPPVSTFEPTKKEANVPNINTIPGDDTFYFDCRILPQYDPDEVLVKVREIAATIAKKFDVTFEFDKVQFERAAPPTAPDAPVVKLLDQAIRAVYDIEPYAGGIGGGTCAAIFRRAGYPAVVWGKMVETAHSPDEYIMIDNLINDAKVYAALFSMPVD